MLHRPQMEQPNGAGAARPVISNALRRASRSTMSSCALEMPLSILGDHVIPEMPVTLALSANDGPITAPTWPATAHHNNDPAP